MQILPSDSACRSYFRTSPLVLLRRTYFLLLSILVSLIYLYVIPLLRYMCHNLLADILTSGNSLWNSAALTSRVFPAHNLRIRRLVRNSTCFPVTVPNVICLRLLRLMIRFDVWRNYDSGEYKSFIRYLSTVCTF